MSRPLNTAAHSNQAPARAQHEQGLQAMRAGRWAEAAATLAAAAASFPDDGETWTWLARARREIGELAGTIEAARRALTLTPGNSPARQLLAEALKESGELGAALAVLDPAAGDCDHEIQLMAGCFLSLAGQPQAAIERLLAAITLKPGEVRAHIALAQAFSDLKMPAAAYECLLTATALGEDSPMVLAGLLHAGLHAARWAELPQTAAKLRTRLSAADGDPAVPFMLLAMPGVDRALVRRAAERYAAVRFGAIAALPAPPPRHPGRLRVGYLSCDFHAHATAYLMAEMLESHDRSRFEVFLYSHGPADASPMRARIEAATEHFVRLEALSDQAAAQRIRADGIDILVDLKGYTTGARTAILAQRPAPMQVNFLGYPGTLGAPFIDYIVGDRVVTPLSHGADYREKIAQMPHCYQPNDRQREIGPRPPRSACGLPDEALVFCCFNNSYKITPAAFDIWCHLLARVPGSVLWLLQTKPEAKAELEREASARGIAAERLIFAPPLPLSAHLARLRNADLVLDTFDYNAHTTASDALWAGVPVVTLQGETFAARVAASLLTTAGLPELIATDTAAYESFAFELAADPTRRQAVRQALVEARAHSPLFDGQGFCADLEALYVRMAERHAAGLAPDHLPAAAAPIAARPPRPALRRVAIVTPYYKESREWLERCLASVRSQTLAATHFVVADGHPQAWLDDAGVRHLKFDCAHGDYGNTPRAIGALLAISEGFDAVCFLDADNWYEPGHVQACIDAANEAAEEPDLVFARRHFVRDDGSILMKSPLQDDDKRDIDTNCFFLLRGAFHTVARWVLMPKPLTVVGDRIYFASVRENGLRIASVQSVTVNYLCTWASMFEERGEAAPDYAKSTFEIAPVVAWRQGLDTRESEILDRLLGAHIVRA